MFIFSDVPYNSYNNNKPRDNKSNDNKPPKAQGQKLAQEFLGLFFLFLGALIMLSLVTFSPEDPTLNRVVTGYTDIQNKAGLFGAYLAGLLVDIFGIGSYVWAFFFFGLGGGFLTKWLLVPWWRILGYFLFGVSIISLASAWEIGIHTIVGGGFTGDYLHVNGLRLFSPTGSAMVWLFILLLSTQLIFSISWISLFKKLLGKAHPVAHREKTEVKSIGTSSNMPALNVTHADKKDSEFKEEKGSFFKSSLSVFGKKKEENLPNLTINTFKQASLFDDKDDKNDRNNYDDEDSSYYRNKSKLGSLYVDDDFDNDDEDYDDFENSFYEEDKGFAYKKSSFNSNDKDKKEDFNEDKNILKKKKDDKPSQNTIEVHSISASENTYSDEDEKPEKWSFFGKKKKPKETTSFSHSLPSPKLLTESTEGDIRPDQKVLDEKATILMNSLADFGIQGEMVCSTPGPVVTMFEVRPAAGVKVSKISVLADDLAMKLKALAVRIQAPIPGCDTVGIEIPNDVRSTVSFRELIQGDTFQSASSLLTMALGKNIGGAPVSADLAKMPHLLVAGATGAGKSVCLNSIILSFLFKAKPDEVQMLLIDPKRIELAIYADLPHLVHPVVTEMNLAKNALLWAVDEMEHRYQLLGDLKVRNIAAYNEKVMQMQEDETYRGENENDSSENFTEDFAEDDNKTENKIKKYVHLPYLVIIIDELADLMLTHGKDVETSIVRLAQLARAAGIHIILATQRPSVDVVTGLIKANFPCRISFQVTSKHDSRTILDTVGAEHLLGKGDMLFKPAGGKLQRLHGAFVPDEDVNAVVNYWKKIQKPNYQVDFTSYGNDTVTPIESSINQNIHQDPVYIEASEYVRTMDKISISALQRRFRIGFNRAARFVEQMEQDGIIPKNKS